MKTKELTKEQVIELAAIAIGSDADYLVHEESDRRIIEFTRERIFWTSGIWNTIQHEDGIQYFLTEKDQETMMKWCQLLF